MSVRTVAGFASSAALVIVAACGGVDNVAAKDYDQTCSVDGDCVLVEELRAEGTSCTITCPEAAINEKAKEKYDTALKKARADCTSVAQPSCVPAAPRCSQGTCAFLRGPTDAGAD